MNAISLLMVKHNLARVEDLLKDSALLNILPLDEADLEFLTVPQDRRHGTT